MCFSFSKVRNTNLQILFVTSLFAWGSPPPRVNFIKVFTHSFYARRSQKLKKLLEFTVFFALLGSGRVKAARKMLGEIDPSSLSHKYLFCHFSVISAVNSIKSELGRKEKGDGGLFRTKWVGSFLSKMKEVFATKKHLFFLLRSIPPTITMTNVIMLIVTLTRVWWILAPALLGWLNN